MSHLKLAYAVGQKLAARQEASRWANGGHNYVYNMIGNGGGWFGHGAMSRPKDFDQKHFDQFVAARTPEQKYQILKKKYPDTAYLLDHLGGTEWIKKHTA